MPPGSAAAACRPDRPAPPEPSGLKLAVSAALSGALLPLREGGAIQRVLVNPELAVRQAAEHAAGRWRGTPTALPPAAGSSLTGPIGRQRRYTWARASLGDVKAIKNELGGTVNDVFLAVISERVPRSATGQGGRAGAAMVPSLIPVSVRAAGEESIYENRVSALVANLPVEVVDPVERLAAMTAQMATLKSSSESEAGEAFVSLRRYTPFALASLFVRLVFSVPQREIVTVTTNVPGPQEPLYALGRRLVEIIPYVPIATTLRTGVAIFTYCGQVTFGVTGDYASTPDLDVLARGIEDGIAELLAAVPSHSEPQPASELGHR